MKLKLSPSTLYMLHIAWRLHVIKCIGQVIMHGMESNYNSMDVISPLHEMYSLTLFAQGLMISLNIRS